MRAFVAAALACLGAISARAQDWTTAGYDAQRSSWVRGDARISPDNLRKPGFQLLWKVKVEAEGAPILLDLLIGDRGFRALGFVGGGADHVVAVDTDLGRIEWQRRLTAPPGAGSPSCAAALAPNVARPTNAALPVAGYGRRGGEAARSAVGEPSQGAVTLAAAAARRSEAALALPPVAPKPSRPRASPHPFAILYVLSSDGALHLLNVMDGADAEPPVPFVPPDADARGLIVVDDVAYVATTGRCGKAPTGVWALDLGTKQVTMWRAPAEIAGSLGPAIGPDGTIYVATTVGELSALQPQTLAPKGVYRSGGAAFTSSPVIFEHHGSMLIAAAMRDGRIQLLDGARLASVGALASPTAGLGAGAVVSWADSGGTRWLLAPGRGGGVALKVVEQDGALAFQPGWTSRDMTPLGPVVISGVIFAASGGRGSPSRLYALDGATGQELWNSGAAIGSVARGLSGESGQVYVGTNDGTLYAFGFPMEH